MQGKIVGTVGQTLETKINMIINLKKLKLNEQYVLKILLLTQREEKKIVLLLVSRFVIRFLK